MTFLKKFLLPHYSELALYLMSYCLLLLIIFNTNGNYIYLLITKVNYKSLIGLLIILLSFFTGLFLSIYHAFSGRKKTLLEKQFMLIFAVWMNGLGGIVSGTYIMYQKAAWLSIFPGWNLISSFLLILYAKLEIIDENNICDENAKLEHVISSTIILSIVFMVCHYIFNFHMLITFSVCISCISFITSLINSTILKIKILNM